jgi:hypothetical protein
MKNLFNWIILLGLIPGLQQLRSANNKFTSQHKSSGKLVSRATVPAFYVAVTGNDDNAGTLEAPFLTFEKAREAMRVSKSIKTTYIRGGTYVRTQTLILTADDNGETWMAYLNDTKNRVTLDGKDMPDVIDILGGSHITIDGLTIQNYTSRGIGIHGGKGWPKAIPNFNNNYSIAANNVISNNIIENGNVPAPGWDRGGIHVEGNTPNNIITHNVVRNVNGYGIAVYSLQPGDDISGTQIMNNFVFNSCRTTTDGGAIYLVDRTVKSSNVFIKNNFVRDYGSYSKKVRGVYLDDQMSNTTVIGNIICGTGSEPVIIHSGNNNAFTGNVIDLGSAGQSATMYYCNDVDSSLMKDNKFTGNIILSSYAVDSAHVGRTGKGAYVKGKPCNNPVITNNYYYNYSTGIVNTGGQIADAFPLQGDPEISGWNYMIATGSPVYQAPVNFPAIAGAWGPPGFKMPVDLGTPPSCLLTGSTDIYLHAESYTIMSGIITDKTVIKSCDDNDWVAFAKVNFGVGYTQFIARLAVHAANAGKTIEVRLDKVNGTLIGTLKTASTGDYANYQEQITNIKSAKGIHTLYIKFAGGKGVANVDYFRFKQ